MKKLALTLGLFCSFAMAEGTASNPVNTNTTNNNSQPKLIMVKGTSSKNQNSYATPTKQTTKKHTSHTKKSKSHETAKKTKHAKTSTKKVSHKTKTTKSTNN